MNGHKRQCDIDAGYSQRWTHRSAKPVIDYRDIGDDLDAQAALNEKGQQECESLIASKDQTSGNDGERGQQPATFIVS